MQGFGRDLEAFDAAIDGSLVDRREDDGLEGVAELEEGDRPVTPAERANSDGNAVILGKDVEQVCALTTDNGRSVPKGIEGEIGRSRDEQGPDDVMPNVLEENTGLKPSPNVSLYSFFVFLVYGTLGVSTLWRKYTKHSFKFILVIVRQILYRINIWDSECYFGI